MINKGDTLHRRRSTKFTDSNSTPISRQFSWDLLWAQAVTLDSLMAEGGYEAVHKVHSAILKLGLQLTEGSVSGASARSLAMLQAFHRLIQARCKAVSMCAGSRQALRPSSASSVRHQALEQAKAGQARHGFQGTVMAAATQSACLGPVLRRCPAAAAQSARWAACGTGMGSTL